MPSTEFDATPQEVRNFALLQVGLIGGFLVLLFLMLGGSDADFPPIWMIVVQLVLQGIGVFFAERVWLSSSPLAADAHPAEIRAQAVGIFAAQTVRKLFYCSAPLLFGVGLGFFSDHGGWPLVIAGIPGLVAIAWEVWPSLRNTSMTAAMLDSQGAESHLVESFLDS
ncbi:MAG: hypothetical protein JWP31_57 [Aeromicrobium sp.]|nr:hypothetical protein [Aeromicrobium sp.]